MSVVRQQSQMIWEVYSPELGRTVVVELPDGTMTESDLVKRYMAHSNTAKGGARGLRKVFRDVVIPSK